MTSTSSFLSVDELQAIGFAAVGENVLIDRTALWFGVERVRIGSNSRVDAYCMIQAGEGGVDIGSYVHIAFGVSIGGSAGVEIQDFCGLSRHVAIYSSSDDYSGGALTNPLVPLDLRHVTNRRVVLEKHAIVGSSCVIMPGVTIGTGAAVGALSFVNKSVPPFTVVSGNPLRKIGRRDRSLLDREREFLARSK
jgi:dTDP-4-amino-4,6-dideoxy-D-glucose acyltransferase